MAPWNGPNKGAWRILEKLLQSHGREGTLFLLFVRRLSYAVSGVLYWVISCGERNAQRHSAPTISIDGFVSAATAPAVLLQRSTCIQYGSLLSYTPLSSFCRSVRSIESTLHANYTHFRAYIFAYKGVVSLVQLLLESLQLLPRAACNIIACISCTWNGSRDPVPVYCTLHCATVMLRGRIFHCCI